LLQVGNQAEQRRFSASGWSNQRDKLALLNLQVNLR
jgi:hypothetical protein